MNKEQFKNSILSIIGYYTDQMVQLSLSAQDAQNNENAAMLEMIGVQAQGVNYGLEQGVNKLLDEIFPEEKEEVESEENSDEE